MILPQLWLFFSSASAQSEWSYVPIDAKFTSISTSSDGSFAVAAAAADRGIPGGIWITKGSNVWEKVANASQEYLWNSLSCSSDGSIIYAAAGNEGIFKSDDYSATYTLAPNTDRVYNWVAVTTDSSGDHAYAIDGAMGATDGVVIVRTADAGQTWFGSQLPSTTYHIGPGNSITTSGDGKYVAASAYGIVLVSSDYGESFEVGFTRGGEYAHFFKFVSIVSSNSGEYVFASTEHPNALIMKNSDYGNREINWEPLEDTWSIEFSCVASDYPGMRLYATSMGFRGGIYQSNDGGNSWGTVDGGDIITNQDYNAVATSSDGKYVYVVADNGIYSAIVPADMPSSSPTTQPKTNAPTQDPTANDLNWERTASPELAWTSTATATSNPAIVFGVGYGTKESTFANQGIWLSKDHGSNFTQVYQDSDLLWMSVAASRNGSYAYAVARPGGIFVSKDTGDSWVLVSGSQDGEWESIVTDSTGQFVYAITKTSDAYVSKDYGNSFNVIESLSQSGVHEWGDVTTSSNGQYVYISTFDNCIYSSSDYGESFTKYEDVEVGDNTGYLEGISTSSDGQYVYVCGQSTGYIHRSVDFGQSFVTTSAPVANWRSITTSSSGMDVYAVNSGGTNGGVWHSSSFGETFERLNVETNNPSFNSVCTSADGNVVYAANGQYIYIGN